MANSLQSHSPSLLLFLACALPIGRASAQEIQSDNTAGLLRTQFAFFIVFAILTFGQLLFLLLWKLIRNRGTKIPTTTETEERRSNLPFYVLMGITLSMFIVFYAIGAAPLGSTSVAYIVIPELCDELMFTTLFALLASCVAERWSLGHNPTQSTQWSGEVLLIIAYAIVGLMVVVTIIRAVVFGIGFTLLSVEMGWAAFGLYQFHNFLFIILAALFVAKAFSLRSRRTNLVAAPGFSGIAPNKALDRSVMFVSPMVCLAALYTAISDILVALADFNLLGFDNTVLTFFTANVVVSGLITFLLLSAILAAGLAL